MPDIEVIHSKIYEIRGFRVMLDFHLAELYEIETKRLKEAVRRNIIRFPSDFMFQLSEKEWNELAANCDQLPKTIKHSYVMPFAFTEQGVAMLSSVLRSPKAIEFNISIMRAFVQMRYFLLENKSILESIEELKKKIADLEEAGEDTLAAINDLSEDTCRELDDIYIAMAEMAKRQKTIDKPRKRIGYITEDET
ncbi:MAG TPA: ORF6N domain-containing protein [Bacteroidales bacterium]|nr:ORF6N domain-containing protein [Bacteroidales bacterium]